MKHDPDRRRQPPAGRASAPTARPATSPTCGTAASRRRRNNIDLGWVLGQRLTRVPLDGSVDLRHPLARHAGQGRQRRPWCRRQPRPEIRGGQLRRNARSDDLPDRPQPLPWRANGSRDLIAPELLKNDGRYRRVTLGGRPTELAFAPDGKTLYVANYLADAIQVVDAESAKLVQTIPLGGPQDSVARRAGRDPLSRRRPLAQPVVQLQHLPQRRPHQRPRLRHAQRRPPGPEHCAHRAAARRSPPSAG